MRVQRNIRPIRRTCYILLLTASLTKADGQNKKIYPKRTQSKTAFKPHYINRLTPVLKKIKFQKRTQFCSHKPSTLNSRANNTGCHANPSVNLKAPEDRRSPRRSASTGAVDFAPASWIACQSGVTPALRCFPHPLRVFWPVRHSLRRRRMPIIGCLRARIQTPPRVRS